jgi:hypothetical protein
MPGNDREQVAHHYARNELPDSILKALAVAGRDIKRLRPADLAAVDEFHSRGRGRVVL